MRGEVRLGFYPIILGANSVGLPETSRLSVSLRDRDMGKKRDGWARDQLDRSPVSPQSQIKGRMILSEIRHTEWNHWGKERWERKLDAEREALGRARFSLRFFPLCLDRFEEGVSSS
jgi:hypothetical protein